MVSSVVSLLSAFVFGAADFLGGLAAKRISSLLATAVAALSGLVGLITLYPVIGGEWAAHDVVWGAISGVSGAIAIALLYASLAIGPMSILSPLTAVIAAIVPMVWGLTNGESFGWIGSLALGLALVAVVLVGFVPEEGAVRPSIRGLAMASGSGIAIGGFFIAIGQTSDESGIVPLIVNRGTNAMLMLVTLALLTVVRVLRNRQAAGTIVHTEPHEGLVTTRRRFDRALKTGVAIAALGGVVDVIANMLILLGMRLGDLTVAAVLSSLYPAGTILLAAIVLKERIAPVQWLGLALGLTAAAMLAVD